MATRRLETGSFIKKWKCLIVDNEQAAVEILKSHIEALDYLELVESCNNAFRATEILHSEKIDLMFLDINMPGLPGTQLLKTIQRPPKIILTTADKNNAFEAFELDAVDFLLKPVLFERFLRAVNKFCRICTAELEDFNSAPGFIYFRADRKMVKVFLKDITYIESFKDYVVIHRQNDEVLKVKYAISSVENMLPQRLFLRIHRSFIVSVKKVTAVSVHDVELGKIELPIGKSYPDVFQKLTGDSPVQLKVWQ